MPGATPVCRLRLRQSARQGPQGRVRSAPVPNDPAYKHTWQAVADEMHQRHGLTWDVSGKDISRLCFVSFDPEISVNLDTEVVPVSPAPPPAPRPPQRSVVHHHTRYQGDAERAVRTAVAMIQSAPLGTRHHTRLKAARLLGGYVAGGLLSEEHAYGALAQALVGHTEDLKGAFKTVEDGLAYGKAHPITLDALEAERQRWIVEHYPDHHTARNIEPQSPSGATNGSNPWVQRWQHRQRAYEARLRLPAREVLDE
jgi:hypothetical protein